MRSIGGRALCGLEKAIIREGQVGQRELANLNLRTPSPIAMASGDFRRFAGLFEACKASKPRRSAQYWLHEPGGKLPNPRKLAASLAARAMSDGGRENPRSIKNAWPTLWNSKANIPQGPL